MPSEIPECEHLDPIASTFAQMWGDSQNAINNPKVYAVVGILRLHRHFCKVDTPGEEMGNSGEDFKLCWQNEKAIAWESENSSME
jgi:hypothetical protein